MTAAGVSSGLPVDPQPRPRSLRQVPFVLVVLAVAAGLALAAFDRFRLASAVLSAAFGLATALRIVLPERDAGLLVVRSRLIDSLCLFTLAAGLTVLTAVVPPPICSGQAGATAELPVCSANLP